MKTKNQILIALFAIICQNGFSQGFANLDFESGVIVLDTSSSFYPFAVYASNAIPGWTATGFTSPNDIFYNGVTLGAPSVSILSTNISPPPAFPKPLDGAFSIDLYGGSVGSPSGASISQTGLVPGDAASILFSAKYSMIAGNTILVSLGGQNIPFFAISAGPNYMLYGGDVSAFAGQTKALTFLAPAGNDTYWEIDDIQFSSSPVPEPSEFAMGALGALLLGFRRWRNSLR